MTKKDFFILVIKLFGLYLFLNVCFTLIPSTITYIITMFPVYIAILLSVLSAIFLCGVFLFIIIKAPWIVEKLYLDKGFEEDRIVMNNVNARDIIKIGSFIIGGLLLIHNIPDFLAYTIHVFADKINTTTFTFLPRAGKFKWIISGVNIVIGFFLLTRFDWIGKMFKTKNTMEVKEDQ